jgi:hypothetical protein
VTVDRSPGLIRAGAALFLIAVLVAVVAALWGFSSAPDRAQDDTSGFDPAGLAKLDGKSLELARFLDAGEFVGGTLVTQEPSVVIALGRSFGLTPEGGDDIDQVELGPGEQAQAYFLGPHQAIIKLAGHPSVISATLSEDVRALRVVAPPRPAGEPMPISGRPYVGVPLPVEPSLLDMALDRRAQILASLGEIVETIDGRPYVSVSISGDCAEVAQVSCTIDIAGVAPRSVDQWDSWSGVATEASGWSVTLEPARSHLAGVPRWLAREAERIARNDPAAAAEIGQYEEVVDFTWDHEAPGLISIRYWRGCEFGSHPRIAWLADHGVADAGVCRDLLDVTVDVPANDVVSRHASQEQS